MDKKYSFPLVGSRRVIDCNEQATLYFVDVPSLGSEVACLVNAGDPTEWWPADWQGVQPSDLSECLLCDWFTAEQVAAFSLL